MTLRLLGLLLALLVAPAWASGNCNAGYPAPVPLQKAFELGDGVVQVTENAGAQVALIARVGLDLSRYGVHYTHVGWLWKPDAQTPWRVLHQLDICGTPQSRLYDTGPANFFMDSLSRYEAVVIVPNPALQARLHTALSGALPQQLKGARYNFFSHPDSLTDQNCTAWALELLAAALAAPGAVTDRASAHAFLRQQPLQLVQVQPHWYQKLYIRLFLGTEGRLEDQPDPQHYQLVSADTVMALLRTQDPAAQLTVVSPADSP